MLERTLGHQGWENLVRTEGLQLLVMPRGHSRKKVRFGQLYYSDRSDLALEYALGLKAEEVLELGREHVLPRASAQFASAQLELLLELTDLASQDLRSLGEGDLPARHNQVLVS